MRGHLLLGLMLPLLVGCAGKNTVAGEEKTKAEQLEAALPSWCEKTCDRLRACTAGQDCSCSQDSCDCVSVDADCEDDCAGSMARWTTGSDTCAASGEHFKSCVDGVSCEQFASGSGCMITQAERLACPEPNGADEPVDDYGSNSGYAGSASYGGTSGSSDPGSVSGGSIAYAGSAPYGYAGSYGYAGTASVGGSPSPGPSVKCLDSYGAGGGAPADGSTAVICEEGRSGCSDGHAYSWICVQNSQGVRACSCLVDSGVSGGFDPGPMCPALAQVNSGCGWNIVP